MHHSEAADSGSHGEGEVRPSHWSPVLYMQSHPSCSFTVTQPHIWASTAPHSGFLSGGPVNTGT